MLAMSGLDLTVLDRPIWNALTTVHASFAEGDELALRYHDAVGPLCAVREQSEDAYESLAGLLRGRGVGVMFLAEPPRLPVGWRIVRDHTMRQMVATGPAAPGPENVAIEKLSERDVPEMVALAELTEPGPFRDRTIELGGYVGIRESGRLAAMAGQRTALTGRGRVFREVSAVCTHPDFRGRGYAGALVASVRDGIVARGETPCLGVREDNVVAFRVYERLGFEVRRTLQVTVVIPPGAG
jgi:ribosomal protein S18 acetylase RimI-like enzyme